MSGVVWIVLEPRREISEFRFSPLRCALAKSGARALSSAHRSSAKEGRQGNQKKKKNNISKKISGYQPLIQFWYIHKKKLYFIIFFLEIIFFYFEKKKNILENRFLHFFVTKEIFFLEEEK